jgi:hypothetical protein
VQQRAGFHYQKQIEGSDASKVSDPTLNLLFYCWPSDKTSTQQTLSPSAYNTPESAHPGSEGDPSPEDALLKTPTSIDEELSFVVPLSPELVQDGITGFDPSQALFDGTSKDNADFYIEIEDASMETAPDVRPYFWKLGQLQRGHTDLDIPGEHGKRITYDNDLVRTGREFLKSARRKGRG